MSELLNIITAFNLVIIPFYCFRRVTRKRLMTFMNPCFYLVILSYFYLTVSSAFLDYRIKISGEYSLFQRFSQQVVQETNLLCHWFVFVFFIFYLISSDPKVTVTEFKPRKKSYQLALFFLGLCTFITLAILFIHGSSLINTSRVEALNIIDYINSRYRFVNIFTIILGSLAVIVWRTKNFRWYLFLLIPIMLDILSRGRFLMVQAFTFAYINYVIISGKKLILPITLLVLGILYFGVVDDFKAPFSGISISMSTLINLMGEFFHTRFTTLITYKFFLNSGDLGLYLASSILGLLPNAIASAILGQDSLNYTEELRLFYGDYVSAGLAGNLVSEALFYGGISFAVISPILIGGFFYVFNQFRVYKYYPGFIFLCYLCSNLFEIMRGSFYSRFPSLLYIMFSYLLWLTIWEWGRLVFLTTESKDNADNISTMRAKTINSDSK